MLEERSETERLRSPSNFPLISPRPLSVSGVVLFPAAFSLSLALWLSPPTLRLDFLNYPTRWVWFFSSFFLPLFCRLSRFHSTLAITDTEQRGFFVDVSPCEQQVRPGRRIHGNRSQILPSATYTAHSKKVNSQWKVLANVSRKSNLTLAYIGCILFFTQAKSRSIGVFDVFPQSPKVYLGRIQVDCGGYKVILDFLIYRYGVCFDYPCPLLGS